MSCIPYVSSLTGEIATLDCATGTINKAFDLQEFLERYALRGLRDIACHGGTMWGVAGDSLIRINTKSGEAIFIGDTGFPGVNALAVASSGILYSATTSGEFIWIDPISGAGTYIGNYGIGGSNADIAFDCNNNLFACVGDDPVLASVDIATGNAVAIGPIGADGPVTGISFYCCRLYGITLGGDVLTINAYSGIGTVIGHPNPRLRPRWSGMATCCNNCGC